MPKFTANMTVVRSIVQSKSISVEIEAEDANAAEELASAEAEKAKYHNVEDQDWDLDEVCSEAQDLEIETADEEGNDDE